MCRRLRPESIAGRVVLRIGPSPNYEFNNQDPKSWLGKGRKRERHETTNGNGKGIYHLAWSSECFRKSFFLIQLENYMVDLRYC